MDEQEVGCSSVSGFIRTEVLRPLKGEHYVVMTYWESKQDFEKWTASDAFRQSHVDTPPKEVFSGPSRLEIHEVFAASPSTVQPLSSFRSNDNH